MPHRLLVLAFVTLLTSTAHAQLTQDAAREGRGSLDLQSTAGAIYRHGFGDVHAVHAPFVTLQARLVQHITQLTSEVALEFDLDAALGAGGYYAGWFGSPWLGLSIASRSPTQTLRLSLGVAPPVSSIQSTLYGAEDFFVSGWNGWYAWTAARPAIPVGLLAMAEWRSTELDVGADLALIAGPTFTAEGAPVNDVSFFAWGAVGAWLTGHLSREVDLGARLQAVGRFVRRNPSSAGPGGDSTQLDASLTPFLRHWTSRAAHPSPGVAFVEWRLNFNFLAPYGPVFIARDFAWSLALAMGTHW